MPSNDEVLLGIPYVYCPSCNSQIDVSRYRVDKYSKQQRKWRHGPNTDSWGYQAMSTHRVDPFPTGEDSPSEAPEKNYAIVTCSNDHCEQYNKFKVMRIERIHTPSVQVDLND